MHFGAPASVFLNAKKLRKNPTRAEATLWAHLRRNKMNVKFRRQHPVGPYICDFYCHTFKLVIEIDGGVHEEEEQKLKDLQRENDLINFGLRILRFSNEEVTCDIQKVLGEIFSIYDRFYKAGADY